MDKNKIQRVYRAIMLVLVTFLITMIATASLMYRYIQKEDTKYVVVSGDKSEIGTDISTIRKIIDEYYLGEIDDEKLKESALKGYVSGLEDEYTSYITKKEYADFNTNIMGNFVGIGIYMSVLKDTDEIVVISPIKNSPAEEAGLKSGDIITKVDGIEYFGAEGLENAANNIKGEAGTIVHLEIKRGEEILEFDITRGKVIMNPVEAEVIEGTNIGYIQVTSFDENVSEDFKNKFEELNSKGITSLIIDLRNNGGGIVNEALKIADFMVPKGGTLLVTLNKKDNEVIEKAINDPIINMPIIVLVNENSASASEILVGALRDNNVAKSVGTKTYGKGVIQEILKLKDGSALKITTEEYFTPNKTKINKVGIKPDVTVEQNEASNENSEKQEDSQLKKAIELLNNK